MKFKLKDHVVYEGKTYRFPGYVSGITDDGQYIVSAINTNNTAEFHGMKHIYGESQLKAWNK